MIPEPANNDLGENTEPIASSERQSSSWDIRNAPRNYIFLVLFQGGSAFFSFASVWLITHLLGAEGYGAIIAVIAASQVAQVLVNWTSVSVVRFGVDEYVETTQIARTFWVRFLILVINLVFVLVLANLWFPPLSDWLKLTPGSYWLVISHFAVTAIWTHVQMSLQGVKMLRMQGFLQMLERLVIVCGIGILIALGSLEPLSAVWCYVAAPAAMTVIGLIKLRKYIFAPFAIDWPFARKIMTFSLPLLPFSLVGFFSGSYVDAVFVTKFLSKTDLGIYSVATQINGIAVQLPTLANSLLLPLFVTMQRESLNPRTFNYFREMLPTITLCWGLACTLLAFVSYYAIPLVFKPEYEPATIPLWILLTASAVWIPVAIGYSALSNSTGTTYISLIAAVAAAAVNIAANFILIPRYGTIGCALATLIAFFVSVATFAVLLKRDAKMPISWSYAAVVPSIAGMVAIVYSESAPIGLIVSIVATALVGFVFRASLHKTLLFVRNYRTANS